MTASTAYYSGDVPGLAGKAHYGAGGRGTLGSLIPSTGDHGPSYLYNSLSLPADASDEFYGPLGALPTGLTLSVDENGAVTAAANDGTYRVPFDLYKAGSLLGSTYFDIAFGQVVQTVTEVAANSTQANTSSTGAATVTPAASAPATVNETAANSTQSNTSGNGVVTVTPASAVIAVPASRTAVFAAQPRVAVFTDTGPVSLTKGIADQVYIIGDFSKPLADGATTVSSVVIVNSNLTVLEGPVAQGSLMVAKIGALDPAGGQFTFRVTCNNGEVIDGTILLTALDDRSQIFWKDPDDHRFYALDVSADLALSGNTTIATVQTPNATGVTALSVPAIQGGKVIVLIGGLELANGATNSCELGLTLATTEVIYRKVFFSKQDH